MPTSQEKSRFQHFLERKRAHQEPSPALENLPRGKSTAETAHKRLQALHQEDTESAGNSPFAEYAAKVLHGVAESEGWEAAFLWIMSDTDGVLHDMASWHSLAVEMRALDSLSRQTTFRPGHGPLGNEWGARRLAAVFDMTLDARSPRALYAAQVGLQWAYYFPLWHGETLVGFFEFFAHDLLPLHGDQVKWVTACGHALVERFVSQLAAS